MRNNANAIAIPWDADEQSPVQRTAASQLARIVTAAERELELLAAAKTDPAQFAPLYEAYADRVWRFAMSRLRDPERARDVTSQTFVKAIQALPSFRPKLQGEGTSFPSWLMMIARNTVIDDQRRHRPTADLDTPELQRSLASASTPESEAVSRDEARRVRQAVSQLNPRQQRMVELRAAGYSGQEIADIMGMTLNGVRTAHSRAYARLRELLADEIEPKEHSR